MCKLCLLIFYRLMVANKLHLYHAYNNNIISLLDPIIIRNILLEICIKCIKYKKSVVTTKYCKNLNRGIRIQIQKDVCGTSVRRGVPVGRRLGGRLAMTLVATINVIIFFLFFFPVVYFSHRRSARIKKLI